jgi:uncharacterized protein
MGQEVKISAKDKAITGLNPYIWLFSSDESWFVLDLHTNKLFALRPREAEVIKRWFAGEGLTDLAKEYPSETTELERLRNEGLFGCQPPEGLSFGAEWDEIKKMILNKRSRTVIELTQKCNLRCKYCTFSGGFKDHRTHSSKTMSKEVLESAINSAFKHGEEVEEINIGFYGGEPLLAFHLLKWAVYFARTKSAQKKVTFSITTNATLVDEKKARFLKDNDFNILVSIDGPEYMHNRYRVYPNGCGSYMATAEGLKLLIDTYPLEMHNHIGLNMVIPSIDWFKHLQELWNNETWLPKSIRAQAVVMDPPDGLLLPQPTDGVRFEDIKAGWLEKTKMGKEAETKLLSDMFDKAFAEIHQRLIYQGRRNSFFPNGCCIPGVRKIYVTVEGNYQICERVHGCPDIGNVESGVDINKIKTIVDDYIKNSFEDCKDCFALPNCQICFANAYESNEYSRKRKREACEFMRESIAQNFADYVLLCRKYPHKMDAWDKVLIS